VRMQLSVVQGFRLLVTPSVDDFLQPAATDSIKDSINKFFTFFLPVQIWNI